MIIIVPQIDNTGAPCWGVTLSTALHLDNHDQKYIDLIISFKRFFCSTENVSGANKLYSTTLFSPSLLSCPIFWPLCAICASATFGTSPPTGTCAKPGTPNQDAVIGSLQLTRLGNCTLTLIFMAGPIFILCVKAVFLCCKCPVVVCFLITFL